MPIKLHQVVFIKRSDVFFAKQERFWNFHVFLKKKQVEENFAETILHKVSEAYSCFSTVSTSHK